MPAAYLGGLSMAVRGDSGRTIEAYVANEQVKGEPRVETLERFYGRERDSRYLIPRGLAPGAPMPQGAELEDAAGSSSPGRQAAVPRIDSTASVHAAPPAPSVHSRSADKPDGSSSGASIAGYELVTIPTVVEVSTRPIGWSRFALGVLLLFLLLGGAAMKARW